ncbi:hypothetical protein BGZ46_004662 [Entomortierella lignicola]|nr:hypothetical protein BGZ46_004662 [Entomortierella lignicola]KAF9204369.1 hypothetical protein BGZ49_005383 [Haplosporangium sp. Z 27]
MAVNNISKFQATDAEERDGFVEYCKLRTCERMEVERTDELEEADEEGLDKMRLIAIESKLEWRGFTDEMKMFWIERGNIKSTLNSWNNFMKDNNVSIPSVYPTGPTPTPSLVKPHDH